MTAQADIVRNNLNRSKAEVIRDQVAGSALALWLRRGPCVQLDLMACTGAHIAYYEATDFLGRRDWAPLDFAQWSTNRIKTANAALSLWLSPRNIPQAWFRQAAPPHIRAVARRMASRVLVENPGYREQHGPRLIVAPGSSLPDRDSAVADAAQWLWLNREAASTDWLARTDSDHIVRACKLARIYSERLEDKKYSLSDLQRAYDLGFAASGEGWNQEIHPNYLDNENYQAERLEALREFSKCQ